MRHARVRTSTTKRRAASEFGRMHAEPHTDALELIHESNKSAQAHNTGKRLPII
jgi:hypothetical protein